MKRLYVGNVNFNATEEDVRMEFDKYGVVVDVKFMTDRETGQFRGFAFVSYENSDDASRAILALDGQLFMGRSLKVNDAEDRRPNGNGGGRQHSAPQGTRLYVGNINSRATPEELRAEFSQYGTVTDLRFMTDRETGQFRGFAFVSYGNKEDADQAILSLNGVVFMERPLRVSEAEDRRPNGNGGGNNYRSEPQGNYAPRGNAPQYVPQQQALPQGEPPHSRTPGRKGGGGRKSNRGGRNDFDQGYDRDY